MPSIKHILGQCNVIQAGMIDKCELCHKEEELRPYGPNGEMICFDCGMGNEAATLERFLERIG